jgi:hypothetical protein
MPEDNWCDEESEEGKREMTNEKLRRLIAKLKYWILKRISMRLNA